MSYRAIDPLSITTEHLRRLESERAVLETALSSHGSRFEGEDEEKRLEQEERQLQLQLREAEEEHERAEAELRQTTAQQELLAAEEEKFWQEQLATLLQVAVAQDEEQCLQQQSAAAQAHLAVLRRTHVLNDCFLILPGQNNSSPFATINGCRIGTAPPRTSSVDWQEVNTAWGHCAMLLTAAASLCGCKFKPYKILPLGSFSRIVDERDESVKMELFHAADSNLLQRMRGGGKFDRGMVAFMQCVLILQNHLEVACASRRTFSPPYAIDGEFIEGVRLKRDSPDWDKATRYLMTNLKYIVCEMALLKKDQAQNSSAAAPAPPLRAANEKFSAWLSGDT